MTTQLEDFLNQILLDSNWIWIVVDMSFYVDNHLIETHQNLQIGAAVSPPKYVCIKLSVYLSIYLCQWEPVHRTN